MGNKNFLVGKTHAESLLTLDGERFHHIKFDTTATPYTLVWYSQPIRSLEGWFPCVRDVIGQDELSDTAKNTVYVDVVGNNPWIGDYKLSRKGEFEQVNSNNFKVSWTGHGETSKGFL